MFTVVRKTGEASGFAPAASSWLRRRPSPRPAGPSTSDRPDSSPPAGGTACSQTGRSAPLSSLDPPGSSWPTMKRRDNTGSLRMRSRLAHQAQPIRRCWAVLTLSRLLPPFQAFPVQAAASFTPPLRRRGDEGLSPPSETPAPHGAQRAHRLRGSSPPRPIGVAGAGLGFNLDCVPGCVPIHTQMPGQGRDGGVVVTERAGCPRNRPGCQHRSARRHIVGLAESRRRAQRLSTPPDPHQPSQQRDPGEARRIVQYPKPRPWPLPLPHTPRGRPPSDPTRR